MRVEPRALLWALVIATFSGAARPAAGAGLTSGLRVNTVTTATQNHPSVAAINGGFVVVWEDESQFTAYARIVAQRFSASGAPLGGEIVVAGGSPNAEDTREPKVTANPGGGFIVVWQENVNANNWEIYVRRYDADGFALRPPKVNTYTTNSQRFPFVSSGGNVFVVVWQSTGQDGSSAGIFGQRYAASGAPAGDEFRVNTVTSGNQTQPVVAADSSGAFVVAWTSADGGGTGVFMQRFAATGEPLGGETIVNTSGPYDQDSPSVAQLDATQTVVTYTNGGALGGTDRNVNARRFTSAGSGIGTDFRVNVTTTGVQTSSAVAANASQFIVSWVSNDQDGSDAGIYARVYDADGTPTTAELAVNAYTTGQQAEPAAAMDDAGRYVIVWTSDFDIYGLLGPSKAGDANGDDSVNVTDVLYLINHLFAGGPPPVGDADVNNDQSVNVTDVLYLINYLFAGGPAPV